MLAEFLFVYGTLKRDLHDSNSVLLEPYTEFFGYASAPGKLYLREDGNFIYPGYVYDEHANSIVRGELLVITDKTKLFQVLDEYEGCGKQAPKPHLFRRDQITVKANVAFEYQAWCYLYNWPVDDLTELEHGTFT